MTKRRKVTWQDVGDAYRKGFERNHGIPAGGKMPKKLRKAKRRVARVIVFDVHAIIEKHGDNRTWIFVGSKPEVDELPLLIGQYRVPATLTVEDPR